MQCIRIPLFGTLALATVAWCRLLPLLFVVSTLSGAEMPDLAVPLPSDETLLADIGMYRVFWQSYDQQTVAMPVSRSGHFEPRAGISYQDWGRVLDRRALLLHSPWHVPPGKTWVDYELVLPRQTPIRLKFGIAMGPGRGAARPQRRCDLLVLLDGGRPGAGTVAPPSGRGQMVGLRF